jgi:hypothetical protein
MEVHFRTVLCEFDISNVLWSLRKLMFTTFLSYAVQAHTPRSRRSNRKKGFLCTARKGSDYDLAETMNGTQSFLWLSAQYDIVVVIRTLSSLKAHIQNKSWGVALENFVHIQHRKVDDDNFRRQAITSPVSSSNICEVLKSI